MPLKIQLRHDTAANWLSANPVLMEGELGVVTGVAGIDPDVGRMKVGNGSQVWTDLPWAMSGPTGPLGPPNLSLNGPVLRIAAGVDLTIELLTKDTYTTYGVSALTGTATLNGLIITYVGAVIGLDTLTITAGDATRELTIEVLANTLGVAPAAPPAIGSPLDGGYYTGAIYDTATTATGSYVVGTLGAVTLTIPPADLGLFYVGQAVRLASTNSSQGLVAATVLAGTGDQLTLDVTATLAGNVGTTYTDWVIAVRWKIILAPKASGENASVLYKTANTAGPAACRTLTNGRAATAAMQAENTNPLVPVFPLAKWITNINTAGGIGGFTDWYIPARDELELVWRNLKPVTNNNYVVVNRPSASYTRDANLADLTAEHGANRHSDPAGAAYTAGNPAQTAVDLFKTGAAEALTFGSVFYWASSEFSATVGWGQYYFTSYPGYQGGNAKAGYYRARAARRSIL